MGRRHEIETIALLFLIVVVVINVTGSHAYPLNSPNSDTSDSVGKPNSGEEAQPEIVQLKESHSAPIPIANEVDPVDLETEMKVADPTNEPETSTVRVKHDDNPTGDKNGVSNNNSGRISRILDNFRSTFQRGLVETQRQLLRLVGLVDLNLYQVEKTLGEEMTNLTLGVQKAAGQAYNSAPPFVNQLIQSFGTVNPGQGDSSGDLNKQILQVSNLWRDNQRQFLNAWEEHEYDWHSVFQDRFLDINRYLGVAPIPTQPLVWYKKR